jgi:hypothetical protein
MPSRGRLWTAIVSRLSRNEGVPGSSPASAPHWKRKPRLRGFPCGRVAGQARSALVGFGRNRGFALAQRSTQSTIAHTAGEDWISPDEP